MVPKKSESIKLRIFGIIAVAVAIIELLLCFTGPIAFIPKPSLVFFPVVSASLTDEENAGVTALLEREIALIKSYAIVSQSFIEEYFIRTDPEFDRSKLKPGNYLEANEIARELDMERFATANIYKYYNSCDLSISIRDVRSGDIMRSYSFASDSLENLLKGIGKNGTELDIQENLKNETRGINFTDFLVLGLLALQLALGLLALSGREPGILAEIVWAPALILFLFAFIHAQSANLDYMQRFIATQGLIHLARSTALEQFYAFLRYGPILLVNGWYYIYRTIEKKREDMINRKKHWLNLWVTPWALPWVVTSALLFALSFPSVVNLEGFAFLAWFCLIPLFLVLLTESPAMGIFYGTLFGVLQALIINYWHGTYKYVTLHLITIGFFVQFLLFMVALVWLIRMSGKWGFLVVTTVWVFFDYCRSISVLGYPWGLIGTTQYRFLSLIQIASLTGVWGISFIILLCNASLAWTLAAPAFGWIWTGRRTAPCASLENRSPGPWKRWLTTIQSVIRERRTLLPVGIFMAILVVSLITGAIILGKMQAKLYNHSEIPKATIVLVQQNTDPRKHAYKENLERLMELTDEALRSLPDTPDLVVWPEGGTKLDIRYWTQPEKKESHWGRLMAKFVDYQKGMGSWLLTGTQDHKMLFSETGEKKKKNFNSSVLLDPQGNIKDFYHKMHLVPFSEHFPLDKERFAGLYELFQKFDISNWGIGEKRLVFQHDKMRFVTPICFEDVFSDHVRRFVLGDADIIINISNDFWSLSPVEGRQHGILALFRAVENQRPLLRSTSSGYTVYIDAVGRIHPGSPEPYTAGYTVAHVPLPDKQLTVYTRWGDWFPLFCGLVCGFTLLILGIMKSYPAWIKKPNIFKLRNKTDIMQHSDASSLGDHSCPPGKEQYQANSCLYYIDKIIICNYNNYIRSL